MASTLLQARPFRFRPRIAAKQLSRILPVGQNPGRKDCMQVNSRESVDEKAPSTLGHHNSFTLSEDLIGSVKGQFGTILADPPWRFNNRTGRVAPEYRRLPRYVSLSLSEIISLPIADLTLERSHLYLWVPNALLQEGLAVMKHWGFEYKTNLVWYKVRKDGGPDGRGVGFYFRNVTELVLFGVRGGMRTFQPGRRQVNILRSRKREHSRKPDELYEVIEQCSPGPYLELFARHNRPGWSQWGNEVDCGIPAQEPIPGSLVHSFEG